MSAHTSPFRAKANFDNFTYANAVQTDAQTKRYLVSGSGYILCPCANVPCHEPTPEYLASAKRVRNEARKAQMKALCIQICACIRAYPYDAVMSRKQKRLLLCGYCARSEHRTKHRSA